MDVNQGPYTRHQWMRWFYTNKIPVFIGLAMFLLGVGTLKWNGNNWRQGVVNSDGRGYYYFLPALVHGDATYATVLEQEKLIVGRNATQPYILQTEKGRSINKCYPGVALLQAPTYLIASGIQLLTNDTFNGYSDLNLYVFFWTSIVLLYLSILLLQSNLTYYFESKKYTWLGAILTVFGSNIAYQAFFYPGLSHHYSFFLANLWIFCLFRWQKTHRSKWMYCFGIVSGLLFVVRPTNLMFFLFLPFLLKTWNGFKKFFIQLFLEKRGALLGALVAFGLTLGILPLVTYAQTGEFFYWSYQGEGFNFNGAHWLDTWFSYRAGILVHGPFLTMALVGTLLFLRKTSFGVVCLWLTLGIITYVLSSWWCWDYQLIFGHRGFTEYHVIIGFGLVFFMQSFQKKWIPIVCIGVLSVYFSMRTYQKITSVFSVQKFTASTFWASMFDTDRSIENKYVDFSNCEPYGRVVAKTDLMYGMPRYQIMSNEIAFWPSTAYKVKDTRREVRYFANVHVNKRLLEGEDWKEVSLVFAGKDINDSLVHYASYPLYNYYKEGINRWSGFDLGEEFYPFKDGTQVIIVYLWNQKGKKYEIDDCRITVSKIVAN